MIATKLARRLRAERALARYEANPFDLIVECFLTFDPKAPRGSPRHRRPWKKLPSPDPHEACFYKIWEGKRKIVVGHKSKQIRFSWLGSGITGAGMILRDGFTSVHQSHRNELAFDLQNRTKYMLENLAGPLEGAIDPADIVTSGEEMRLTKVLGEPRHTSTVAIPSGPAKWRAYGPTFGHLDELSYHRHQEKTLHAAMSACEGPSSVLFVVGTGAYGTHFNEKVQEIIRKVAAARGTKPQEYNSYEALTA